jgi:hypothetical protein
MTHPATDSNEVRIILSEVEGPHIKTDAVLHPNPFPLSGTNREGLAPIESVKKLTTSLWEVFCFL